MKNLGIKVGSIVVVLITFYTCLWFYLSKIVKEDAVNYLNNINDSEAFDIAYDEITVSGYPFSIKVNIENPKVNFNLEQSYYLSYSSDSQALYPLKDKWEVDGVLEVKTGLFAKKFKFSLDGIEKISIQNPKTGAYSIINSNEQNNENYLQVKLFKSVYREIFDFSQKDKIIEQLVNNVDTVEAVFNNYKYYDSNGKEIYTYNKYNLLLTNIIGMDNTYDISLDLNSSEESTADFYKILYSGFSFSGYPEFSNNFRELLNIYIDNLPDKDVVNFSTNSNLNIKLDDKGEISNLGILINSLNYVDSLVNYSSKANISIAANEGEISKLLFNYQDNVKFSEACTKTYQKILDTAFNKIIINYFPVNTETFPDVGVIFPKLHELGNIKDSIIFEYTENDKGNNLKITDVSFINDLYSFKIDGEKSVIEENLNPVYNLNLYLNNYQLLVGDLVRYVGHLTTIINSFSGKEIITIPGDLAISLETYLEQISNQPQVDKNNVVISIVTDQNGNILIGGKPMSEIQSIYGHIFSTQAQENKALEEAPVTPNPEQVAPTIEKVQ